MGDGKNHYRTMTYDMLCVCGACVSSTNYEIFEEPCDYELGLTSGTCKYCKNEANTAAIVLNKAVNGTKNVVATLGNELTSTDTVGKTVEALALGENAEEQTVSGVVLETIASFAGTDVLLDARDLTTSITNFNKNSKEDGFWKALGTVGFNALCLAPIVGGGIELAKNMEKATDAVKAAEKAGDIASSVKSIKKVEKVVDTVDAATAAGKVTDKVDNVTDVVKTADAVADSAQTAAKAVDRTADITDNANDVAKAAVTVYDPEFAAKQLLQDGKTTEDALKNIIPKNATNTFVQTSTISEGYKYKFDINGNKIEVKYHSKDLNAAVKYPDSNSGTGWTAQINVNGKLLGQDGIFYKKPSNVTHIPME